MNAKLFIFRRNRTTIKLYIVFMPAPISSRFFSILQLNPEAFRPRDGSRKARNKILEEFYHEESYCRFDDHFVPG
ncbi:MAG TPA: hypothetical protein VK859_16100, partial [bacterium]|nr:hypothetical protein [bacterium]